MGIYCAALLATIMFGGFHNTFFFKLDTLFFRKGCECSLPRKRQNRACGSEDGLVHLKLIVYTADVCTGVSMCMCGWGRTQDLKLAHNPFWWGADWEPLRIR